MTVKTTTPKSTTPSTTPAATTPAMSRDEKILQIKTRLKGGVTLAKSCSGR